MKTKLKKFGAWLMAMALAFAGAGAGLSDFGRAEARDGNEDQVAKRMEFLKGILHKIMERAQQVCRDFGFSNRVKVSEAALT